MKVLQMSGSEMLQPDLQAFEKMSSEMLLLLLLLLMMMSSLLPSGAMVVAVMGSYSLILNSRVIPGEKPRKLIALLSFRMKIPAAFLVQSLFDKSAEMGTDQVWCQRASFDNVYEKIFLMILGWWGVKYFVTIFAFPPHFLYEFFDSLIFFLIFKFLWCSLATNR